MCVYTAITEVSIVADFYNIYCYVHINLIIVRHLIYYLDVEISAESNVIHTHYLEIY